METTIRQDLNIILDSPQGKCLEKYIKKHYPQEYPIVLSAPGKIWKEKLYNYIYHNNSVHRCPICGNLTKFISITDGYLQYCSIECVGKSKSRIEKIQNTCKIRYGVANASQLEEIKEKKKDTLSSHYGSLDDAYSHIQQKMKETNLIRYGVANIFASEKFKNDIRQSHIDRIDDLIAYTDNGDWICKCPHPETCNQCQDGYYIISSWVHCSRKDNNTELCTKILPIQPTFSTYELQVRSWLDELGIIYNCNDRSILNGRELDIYIPKYHLAIEINGCYWHSNACKPKSYHMDKWSQCKDKGIKMITLWEDWIQDHPDECKQLIMYHLGRINTINVPWDHNLVDLGLGSGSVKEHLSIHGGYECWDCGLFT